MEVLEGWRCGVSGWAAEYNSGKRGIDREGWGNPGGGSGGGQGLVCCASVTGSLTAAVIFFQAAVGGHGSGGDVELGVVSVAAEAAAMRKVMSQRTGDVGHGL